MKVELYFARKPNDLVVKKLANNRAAVKLNPRCSALALLLAVTVVGAGEKRTWSFKSGATMEAEVVGFPSPDTVAVKRSDGKVYTLPVAYLTDADRAFLDAERAKQWKQVSVDKLLGTVARYKKCAVSGADVSGEILVAMLPSQAEAVLNSRQQQEAQIADLKSQIQSANSVARAANAPATGGSGGYGYAHRPPADPTPQDVAAANTRLDKLKADYAEYVKKTKAATTLLLKNTGLVYEHLPVWECQALQKRQ